MPVMRFLMAIAFVLATVSAAHAQRFITVASTTSPEQSGLFNRILPIFTKKTGVEVRVVSLGSGQALDMARRGEADVVFVNSKAAEERFVAEGHGVGRLPVMYNDFVLVGPRSDPANVRATSDVLDAFRRIKAAAAPFVSRADQSGTHQTEVELWKQARIDIGKEKGRWYHETGQGMGPALSSAASMKAYLLTDRGTWISFKNRGELVVVLEGDKRLFNQYGVILVSSARHPKVKRELGLQFIDWLVSPEGQRAIGEYRIEGEQLFFPDARRG